MSAELAAEALAWIEGDRVVRRESRLIRPPEMRFSPGNIRVHGILPADVRGQPDARPRRRAEIDRDHDALGGHGCLCRDG